MAIFTMADLHLSESVNKPMDKFGVRWQNYREKIIKNWNSVVSEKDTVIVPGDISWGMDFEEAKADLKLIQSLNGYKLLGRGNHDYWWNTVTKMKKFLESENITGIDFLYNNAFKVEDKIIASTRGWYIDEKLQNAQNMPDYNKIVRREALRCEMCITEGEKLRENTEEIIVFFHFPPIFGSFRCDEIIEVLKKHEIKRVYFGHIHGSYRIDKSFEYDGITYTLISADYLNFVPELVR